MQCQLTWQSTSFYSHLQCRVALLPQTHSQRTFLASFDTKIINRMQQVKIHSQTCPANADSMMPEECCISHIQMRAMQTKERSPTNQLGKHST